MVKVFLETLQLLYRFYSSGREYGRAVVSFQLRHSGDNVVVTAFPVLTRVPSQVQLFDKRQLTQASDALPQVLGVYEVDREVDLLEALTPLDVLDDGNVVEGHVEVLQLLKFVEVLQLLDDVVLQVEDLQVPAEYVQILDLGDLLLVEGDLLEGREHSLVVLCSLPQQVLGYSGHQSLVFKLYIIPSKAGHSRWADSPHLKRSASPNKVCLQLAKCSRRLQNLIQVRPVPSELYLILQMSKHPNIKWAQRKDKVFISIQVRDAKNEKVDLKAHQLQIDAESDGDKYSVSIQLFAEVIPEQSKWSKTGMSMQIVLQKKDTSIPYWPRLIQQTQKQQYITLDWSRWIDEDDEKEEGQKGMEGYDPTAMNNFNDSDSDDEAGNLDDLDKDQQPEGSS